MATVVKAIAPSVGSASVPPTTCRVVGCKGKTKSFFVCENPACKSLQCPECIKRDIFEKSCATCHKCHTMFSVPFIGDKINPKTAGELIMANNQDEIYEMRLRIMTALESFSTAEKPVWAITMQNEATAQAKDLRAERKKIIWTADPLFIAEKESKSAKTGKVSVTRKLLTAKDAVNIPTDRVREFFELVKTYESLQARLKYNEMISKYWSSQEVSQEVNKSAQYVSWCRADGCFGAVNDEGVCCLCETLHCEDCMAIHEEEDECDSESQELYEQQERTSCPLCFAIVHGFDGCAKHCTNCSHTFDIDERLTTEYWYRKVMDDMNLGAPETIDKKAVRDTIKLTDDDDTYTVFYKSLISDFLNWADELESFASPKDLLNGKKDLTFYSEKTNKSYKLRQRASLLFDELYDRVLAIVANIDDDSIWEDTLKQIEKVTSDVNRRVNAYGGLFKWSFMAEIHGCDDGRGGFISTEEGKKAEARLAKAEAKKADREALALLQQEEQQDDQDDHSDDKDHGSDPENPIGTENDDPIGFETVADAPESPDITPESPVPVTRRVMRPRETDTEKVE